MKTLLKFIGLFDQQERVHGVELKAGLNLITGRSSTGKSSLIEIFDYCMASSEDTIPHGVIKDNAKLFFLWITIGKVDYILGRDADGKEFYIVDHPLVEDVWQLSTSVFDEHDFKREDYKIQLGILFGIDAQNTAETAEQLKDKRKGAQRPTVRNMMPFVLQHQNLVANKQALFYRFDQKEKREETIDQFKVFAGFVDANYYALSVEASILKEKIDRLEKKLSKAREDIHETYNRLLDDIDTYSEITGSRILEDITEEKFLDNPESFKSEIENLDYFEIKIDPNSKPYLDKYRRLEAEENKLMAELRETQIHLEDIISSIDYIETYKNALEATHRPQGVTLNYSVCPFCHQHTTHTLTEVKGLAQAINNLNEELKNIPSIVRPLHEEKIHLQESVEELKSRLGDIDKSKDELTEIIEALKKNYSLQKQAYKTIYKISSRIDLASNEAIRALQQSIYDLSIELSQRMAGLNVYNLDQKMILAERAIRQSMAQYRKTIKFEPSLDDYSLVFDLKKFELYFQKGMNEYAEKKYLRAIGSGANWLNAHLCLFLALADFFYSHNKSTVPSLLFLDQPSQVYFPAQKDTGEEFNPEESGIGKVDDDMIAVNNIFTLLYKFCNTHGNGIQIIVTDHADDLSIEGLDDFEEIVRARWRKEGEGLIDLTKL